MSRRTLFSGLCAIAYTLVLCGCGGAGGAGSSPNTSTQGPTVSTVGNTSITYSGKLTPLQQGGGTPAIVLGGAGASISNLTFMPVLNPASTPMVYAMGPAVAPAIPQIWSYYQYNPKQLTSLFSPCRNPIYSSDGRIAFMTAGSTAIGQIFTCRADGSGITQLTADSVAKYSICWSAGNSRILYDNGTDIYAVNSSTGASLGKIIAGGTSPFCQPDSSDIYFLAKASSTATYQNVFVLKSGTTTPVNVSNNPQSDSYPTLSPDGTHLAFTFLSGSNSIVRQIDLSNSSRAFDFVVPNVTGLCYSADGKTLYVTGYSTQSASYVVTGYSLLGGTVGQLYLGTGTLSVNPVSCQPFQKSRSFVGTSGTMFTTPVAGFLLTEVSDTFTSLLAFAATTPSTATITSVSSAAPDFVYRLHADSITSLKFANDYYMPPTVVTPNVPDVLVSINQTTGQVTFMAPYAVRPGKSAPTAVNGIYSGDFTAVYDRHGKNLAPSGTQTISVRNGAVSVF